MSRYITIKSTFSVLYFFSDKSRHVAGKGQKKLVNSEEFGKEIKDEEKEGRDPHKRVPKGGA